MNKQEHKMRTTTILTSYSIRKNVRMKQNRCEDKEPSKKSKKKKVTKIYMKRKGIPLN
jgi:hypothetical protein